MKHENDDLNSQNSATQQKPSKLDYRSNSFLRLYKSGKFYKSFATLFAINDAINEDKKKSTGKYIDLTVANPVHSEEELKSYCSPAVTSSYTERSSEWKDYADILPEFDGAIRNFTKLIIGVEEECSFRVDYGIMTMYSKILYALKDSTQSKDFEVLLVTPIFGQFCTIAEKIGVRTNFFEVKEENDWELKTEDEIRDFSELLRSNPKIKAIVLNYPNNPTGKTLTESGAKNLARAIRESGRKDIVVISDEILATTVIGEQEYVSFAKFAQSETDPISCITLHSGSKIGNVNNRIAFMTVYPADMDMLDHYVSDDYRLPLQDVQMEYLNLIHYLLGEKSADELKLNPESSRNECRKKIEYIRGKIKELNDGLNSYFGTKNVTYVEPYITNGKEYPDSGNTINIKFNLKGHKVDDKELNNADDVSEFLFEKAGVAMVSGGTFCSEKLLDEMVLRMALFPNTKIIDEAFHRITEAIKEHCIPPQEKPKTDIEVKSFERQAVNLRVGSSIAGDEESN